MPDDDFDSIDAIEKHYGKQIKAAGDDAEKVRDLQIDQREAKADFRDRSSARRELESHRSAAIAKANVPEDFHDFVTGDTPEAINASVAKVKERIDKLTNATADQGAQDLYGKPLNGGGSPPPPRSTDEEKWIEDFQRRFDTEGESFTVGEVKKYGEILGGAHLLREMSRWSKPMQRAGITPELVAAVQDGKVKQVKPSKSGVTAPQLVRQ